MFAGVNKRGKGLSKSSLSSVTKKTISNVSGRRLKEERFASEYIEGNDNGKGPFFCNLCGVRINGYGDQCNDCYEKRNKIKETQTINQIKEINEMESRGDISKEMAEIKRKLAKMSDSELLEYHEKNPPTFKNTKPIRGLVTIDDQGLEGQFIQKDGKLIFYRWIEDLNQVKN